ncbi:MAG: glycosyltransferase family 2 protein [Bacteroides sp.]|nr:glycosyltransferase family 2 protein [Bacteroides sp.]
MKKKISIVTACFNEEDNIEELANIVRAQFENLNYDYEHIIIDNNSQDNTVKILRRLANADSHIKVILNAKNFGQVRSPYYGLLQAYGDAVIMMAADFQEPPTLIPEFIKRWEEGYTLVLGVKTKSEENSLLFSLRKMYYKAIAKSSSTEHITNFTGFGLYDQSFVNVLRNIEDPYPYFRGMVAELGSNIYQIEFTQPIRKGGKTKNNFYTLYDMAMLGFVNQSKLPLRMACFIGFWIALLSLLTGLGYLIYKLIYWDSFTLGMAPLVIGLFFFSSIQLIFIGIIGEYIGAIYTQVHKKPLVIEKERINFD